MAELYIKTRALAKGLKDAYTSIDSFFKYASPIAPFINNLKGNGQIPSGQSLEIKLKGYRTAKNGATASFANDFENDIKRVLRFNRQAIESTEVSEKDSSFNLDGISEITEQMVDGNMRRFGLNISEVIYLNAGRVIDGTLSNLTVQEAKSFLNANGAEGNKVFVDDYGQSLLAESAKTLYQGVNDINSEIYKKGQVASLAGTPVMRIGYDESQEIVTGTRNTTGAVKGNVADKAEEITITIGAGETVKAGEVFEIAGIQDRGASKNIPGAKTFRVIPRTKGLEQDGYVASNLADVEFIADGNGDVTLPVTLEGETLRYPQDGIQNSPNINKQITDGAVVTFKGAAESRFKGYLVAGKDFVYAGALPEKTTPMDKGGLAEIAVATNNLSVKMTAEKDISTESVKYVTRLKHGIFSGRQNFSALIIDWSNPEA